MHTVAAIGGCFVALQQSARKDKCVLGNQMGPETKCGLRRLEILVEYAYARCPKFKQGRRHLCIGSLHAYRSIMCYTQVYQHSPTMKIFTCLRAPHAWHVHPHAASHMECGSSTSPPSRCSNLRFFPVAANRTEST